MISWTRETFELVEQKRLHKKVVLRPIEQAALAYTRWQGLTDEPSIDRDAQKAVLDAILDTLDETEPDAWSALSSLATEVGDPVLVGLMHYSLQRSAAQLHTQSRDTLAEMDRTADVGRKNKRRRDRDR